MTGSPPSHFTRDLELEALETAVRWPQPAPSAVLTLAGRFAARGRAQDAFEFFQERADAESSQPLFRALEAQFELQLIGAVPSADPSAWLESAIGSLARRSSSRRA